MTSTFDASLLVYGANEASPLHERASAFIETRLVGPDLVYLFWPVAMAYLRISTHPRIFPRPQALEDAVVEDARPAGNLGSDAHLVTLMRENGVRTIWTRDRDFGRFSGIEVRDPFA